MEGGAASRECRTLLGVIERAFDLRRDLRARAESGRAEEPGGDAKGIQ